MSWAAIAIRRPIATLVVVAIVAACGASPGPSPAATDLATPSPSPSESITLSPSASPEPTITIAPSPEPAPSATATVPATESPTPTEAIPTLEENLANWMAPEGTPNRIDLTPTPDHGNTRFYKQNGEILAYGLNPNDVSIDNSADAYSAFFLGAKKVDDNKVVVFFGFESKTLGEDKEPGRFLVPFGLAEDIVGIGTVPSYTFTGWSIDFGETITTANEIYSQTREGIYLLKPTYLQTYMKPIGYPPLDNAIPINRELARFARAALRQDWRSIKPKPDFDFINLSNITLDNFNKIPKIGDFAQPR